MISYRHHIVSLVAVFLALAVGVVLGGGPLTDLGRSDPASSAQVQAKTKVAQRSATYGDDFASAAAATLYGKRLANHSVSILTLPGADGATVSALAAQVEAAGGTVAGTYEAQPTLVDASEKSLVDTLGSQLLTQLGSGLVAADASTYDRMGQLLALAMGATKVRAQDATSIRQSLSGAGLMTSPEAARPAGLVLVVLGDRADPAILSGLLSGLAVKSVGVVVGGDAVSGASGDLAGLRTEPVADQVATVDGVDSSLGQVTAVLALARSLTVQGGAFGASGSDGTVPLR